MPNENNERNTTLPTLSEFKLEAKALLKNTPSIKNLTSALNALAKQYGHEEYRAIKPHLDDGKGGIVSTISFDSDYTPSNQKPIYLVKDTRAVFDVRHFEAIVYAFQHIEALFPSLPMNDMLSEKNVAHLLKEIYLYEIHRLKEGQTEVKMKDGNTVKIKEAHNVNLLENWNGFARKRIEYIDDISLVERIALEILSLRVEEMKEICDKEPSEDNQERLKIFKDIKEAVEVQNVFYFWGSHGTERLISQEDIFKATGAMGEDE